MNLVLEFHPFDMVLESTNHKDANRNDTKEWNFQYIPCDEWADLCRVHILISQAFVMNISNHILNQNRLDRIIIVRAKAEDVELAYGSMVNEHWAFDCFRYFLRLHPNRINLFC